jgi:prolyl 4-hydroxylase
VRQFIHAVLIIQLTPKRQAKLFCRYRHNNHPFLLLQPIKEEQLFDRPAIFLYYNVISHRDIDQIKSLAAPRVRP